MRASHLPCSFLETSYFLEFISWIYLLNCLLSLLERTPRHRSPNPPRNRRSVSPVCLLLACLLAARAELPAACCPPVLAVCLLLALRCLLPAAACCLLASRAALLAWLALLLPSAARRCLLPCCLCCSLALAAGRQSTPSGAPLCLWVLPNLWIFFLPACFLIRRWP